MARIHTGNRILDDALAGGIPAGVTLLVTGEEGAGATEFALAVLHAAVTEKAHPRRARFASALRSRARVQQEVKVLFEDGERSRAIEVLTLEPANVRARATDVLEGLDEGDVLVIESAMSLAPPGDGYSLMPFWHTLADAAQAQGVTVVLLHAPGTLPAPVEAALAEGADGIMRFSWHDSGPTKRRMLSITKLRGLAPVLDGDAVPVFEVQLKKGVGFDISRGNSVL